MSVKAQPCGERSRTEMAPPCARATALQTERPSPTLRVPSGSEPPEVWKA